MNGVTLQDALALVRAFAADTEGAALVVHGMAREELIDMIGRLAMLLRFAVDDEFEALAVLVGRLEDARTETGTREDNGR
jgi:hypothetical protein